MRRRLWCCNSRAGGVHRWRPTARKRPPRCRKSGKVDKEVKSALLPPAWSIQSDFGCEKFKTLCLKLGICDYGKITYLFVSESKMHAFDDFIRDNHRMQIVYCSSTDLETAWVMGLWNKSSWELWFVVMFNLTLKHRCSTDHIVWRIGSANNWLIPAAFLLNCERKWVPLWGYKTSFSPGERRWRCSWLGNIRWTDFGARTPQELGGGLRYRDRLTRVR